MKDLVRSRGQFCSGVSQRFISSIVVTFRNEMARRQ